DQPNFGRYSGAPNQGGTGDQPFNPACNSADDGPDLGLWRFLDQHPPPPPPPPECTVSAVTISDAPATLEVNETAQLTANVTTENCTTTPTITWGSSAGAVATVSN